MCLALSKLSKTCSSSVLSRAKKNKLPMETNDLEECKTCDIGIIGNSFAACN